MMNLEPTQLPSPTPSRLSPILLQTLNRPLPAFEGSPAPSSSSTNKVILDYLLNLSIQSRLKQAEIELLERSSHLLGDSNPENPTLRKRQWLASRSKAEQDKKAVESIVAGILSSHQNKKPSFQIDANLEQRLHLCQLTNLVFGRFDASSFHASHLSPQHEARLSLSCGNNRARLENDTDDDAVRFATDTPLSFCRRHRRETCQICNTPDAGCKQNTSHRPTSPPLTPIQRSLHLPIPGLMDAIPVFLKTSADLLRRSLETNRQISLNERWHLPLDETLTLRVTKPMIYAGQNVMGGGMPPQWYDLFLDLLTQAAIEAYLCDEQTGPEAIFEIFSYGYVEDEDEPDDDDDEDDDEEEGDEHDSNARHVQANAKENKDHDEEDVDDDDDEDEDDDQPEESWYVKAADHHLLFPKTRTMFLFKAQVRKREKEFLSMGNLSLKQHLLQLVQRYPLEGFEKSMKEFIHMVMESMDVPALEKHEQDHPNSDFDSTTVPVYRYPSDGSLLMPEIPDDNDDELYNHVPERTNKRSMPFEDCRASKRHAS